MEAISIKRLDKSIMVYPEKYWAYWILLLENLKMLEKIIRDIMFMVSALVKTLLSVILNFLKLTMTAAIMVMPAIADSTDKSKNLL